MLIRFTHTSYPIGKEIHMSATNPRDKDYDPNARVLETPGNREKYNPDCRYCYNRQPHSLNEHYASIRRAATDCDPDPIGVW